MKTYTTREELIKDINKTRLENKNNWYYFKANFKNNILEFKAFDTWVQRLDVYQEDSNGNLFKNFSDSSPMELSVKDFKSWVLNQLYFNTY